MARLIKVKEEPLSFDAKLPRDVKGNNRVVWQVKPDFSFRVEQISWDILAPEVCLPELLWEGKLIWSFLGQEPLVACHLSSGDPQRSGSGTGDPFYRSSMTYKRHPILIPDGHTVDLILDLGLMAPIDKLTPVLVRVTLHGASQSCIGPLRA